MPTKTPLRSRRLVMQENVAAYLFLLPFLIFFVGFVLYPMFMCLFTSFFDATMGRKDIFIGFQNYKELTADPVFWIALAREIQDECCHAIYEMCSCKGNMYAAIKGILRENGGPDIGSVRAPLYELQPEDEAIVKSCAARIRGLIAKYC